MSILDAQSITIIGASAQEGKVGHDILKNLLTQGYKGTVYPVNPKGSEILGAHVYASITEIPTIPDLAIIVIPATVVPSALTECGEKGIKHVIVISAGFGEIHTDDGKQLEQHLISIAEKYHIQLVGPNCLGIVRPHANMNASFAKDLPPAGNVGIISQSGATAVALMDSATHEGIGFSAVISIGNKAVMDENDWLNILADDEKTKVIGLYLESIKDGRRFLENARKLVGEKPIVLLKAGVSEHGRKAASSHTGALAGSDAGIEALCAQAGIHRAHTSEEFFDLLTVLSNQPTLQSNAIGIITNAGGPGILATDAAAECTLTLPALSESNAQTLRPKLPAAASVANPIDVIGDAGMERYEAVIDACQSDPNIDGLVIILTPQVMTPCTEIAKMIVRKRGEAPLMPMVTCFMGNDSVKEAKDILKNGHIPCFETPERTVRAMRALQRTQVTNHESRVTRKALDSRIKTTLLNNTSGLLDEATTAELFAAYNLPLPAQAIAKTSEEAVHIAEQIGYPVIAKISSPDILHKTDVGGVRANLKNATEVITAFNEILHNVDIHFLKLAAGSSQPSVNGILIQKFLPVGNEFIVGAIRDPSFGPLIMVGLGGIYTELFKDTVFRIAPISEAEAYGMLCELTSWKLLLGMRGKARADIDALASLIAKVSQMVNENPSINELDLNPVLVGSDGIVIADVKVVIE